MAGRGVLRGRAWTRNFLGPSRRAASVVSQPDGNRTHLAADLHAAFRARANQNDREIEMSFDAPRASGHHQLTSIRLKQGLESPVLQTESDTQLFQTHSRRRRPDCLRFATCYRTRQDRGPGLWVCNLELNNVDFRESREATVQSRSGVVEALFRKQT